MFRLLGFGGCEGGGDEGVPAMKGVRLWRRVEASF